MQLAWISVQATTICGFAAAVALVSLQIRSPRVWLSVAASVLLLPSLFFWRSASRLTQNVPTTEEHLKLLAQAAAGHYRQDNRRIAVRVACSVCLLIAVVATKSPLPLQYSLQGLLVLSVAYTLAPLLNTFNVWYRFFYSARQVPVPQERAEIHYHTAFENLRRHVAGQLQPFVYQNYCAVVRGVCDKTLEHQGRHSIFLAYPFRTKYRRRMQALTRRLQGRADAVLPPPGNQAAEILVCKVCKSILCCSDLVADVSESNRNVYFELGLAKGFGRRTWMMAFPKGDTPRALDNPILLDTIRVQGRSFESSTTASKIVTGMLSATLLDTANLAKLVQPERFHELSRSDADTVLVIGPKMVADDFRNSRHGYGRIYGAIRKRMDAHGLVSIEHVQADISHRVAVVLGMIRTARAVIGLFAGENTELHEELNSVISYLLGYALATETRVLAFQKLASRRMLDFHGLIVNIADADELEHHHLALLDDLVSHEIPGEYKAPPG